MHDKKTGNRSRLIPTHYVEYPSLAYVKKSLADDKTFLNDRYCLLIFELFLAHQIHERGNRLLSVGSFCANVNLSSGTDS